MYKIIFYFIFQIFWDTISAEAVLNLPPSITSSNANIVYYDRNPDDPSGDSNQLILPCKATGTAPLTYSWRFNDSQNDLNINDISKYKRGQDGDLEFVRPVQLSTTGIYQCFAKNTFGTALSNRVSIRLYTYPQSSSQALAFSASEGSSYHLPCTTPNRTDPKPFFVWQTVANFQDQNYLNVDLNNNIRMDENGTLYFAYLRKSDSIQGRLYRCQIRNPYINSQLSFVGYSNLTVIPSTTPSQKSLKLMFSSIYPVIPLVSGSVTMYCFFEGADDIAITWMLPSGNSPSGQRYEIFGNYLKILILAKTDLGLYKCKGTSTQLNSQMEGTINLNIKESPVFLQRPQDKTSSQGTTIVFNCSARADPPAVYNWYRNGEPLQPNNLRSKKKKVPTATLR